MKKSTTAALLSAFIFPGLGHLYLKKYLTGILLVVISFTSIYYLVSSAVEMALEISSKIESGAVQPDIATITAMVSQQSNSANAQLANIATIAFFICWLIGIIDAYRLGKARDKSNKPLLDK
ncbi:DUF6677 family protein [Kaarinaea lacus]